MRRSLATVLLVGPACSADVDLGHASGWGGTDTAGESTTVDEPGSTTSTSTVDDDTTVGATVGDDGASFDVGIETTGAESLCKVNDGLDAIGGCDDHAPPDSFTPVVQWSWDGSPTMDQSLVTPLVANLTDDNGDGAIDLCDTPDVVVTGYLANGPFDYGLTWFGRIAVLDGATGTPHFEIDHVVGAFVTPAIGDIDGDGVPEIVTAEPTEGYVAEQGYIHGRLVAFSADGSLLWTGDDATLELVEHAVTLADLDADGDVEIVLAGHVADHHGHELWSSEWGVDSAVPTAADLDDDGDLEVVFGPSAFHHDGTPYYTVGDPVDGGMGTVYPSGVPQVLDIDADGLPEVLVVDFPGSLTVIEHDGIVSVSAVHDSSLEDPYRLISQGAAAIHDIDGDGLPDVLVNGSNVFSAFDHDLEPMWSAPLGIQTAGFKSGTAFDFLGDGSAEAMVGDVTSLFALGADGAAVMTVPRSSVTALEYPVVADVDNDGSAEIVVVANNGYEGASAPLVQVIRDEQDRWIPARRIWNQHAYHVTNVREDGTIPQVQEKHWLSLNTFRTQAQIVSDGGVCEPEG